MPRIHTIWKLTCQNQQTLTHMSRTFFCCCFQKMNSSQFGFSLYLDLTGKARDTATSPNFQFCQKYCFGSVKSRLPTETKTDLASVKTFVHGRGRQWIVRFDWQPLSIASIVIIERFTEPKIDFSDKPVSTVWLLSVFPILRQPLWQLEEWILYFSLIAGVLDS